MPPELRTCSEPIRSDPSQPDPIQLDPIRSDSAPPGPAPRKGGGRRGPGSGRVPGSGRWRREPRSPRVVAAVPPPSFVPIRGGRQPRMEMWSQNPGDERRRWGEGLNGCSSPPHSYPGGDFVSVLPMLRSSWLGGWDRPHARLCPKERKE